MVDKNAEGNSKVELQYIRDIYLDAIEQHRTLVKAFKQDLVRVNLAIQKFPRIKPKKEGKKK
jgi:hypothetical protein